MEFGLPSLEEVVEQDGFARHRLEFRKQGPHECGQSLTCVIVVVQDCGELLDFLLKLWRPIPDPHSPVGYDVKVRRARVAQLEEVGRQVLE